MVAADLGRLAAVALLAGLTLTGSLALWHVIVLVVVYGSGQAFYAPAFDALVPGLLPETELAEANALDQVVRPIALRMAGPALGGAITAALGAGAAFALDAATFAASAAAVLSLAARPAVRADAGGAGGADLREGVRVLRGRGGLWGAFTTAPEAHLLFI